MPNRQQQKHNDPNEPLHEEEEEEEATWTDDDEQENNNEDQDDYDREIRFRQHPNNNEDDDTDDTDEDEDEDEDDVAVQRAQLFERLLAMMGGNSGTGLSGRVGGADPALRFAAGRGRMSAGTGGARMFGSAAASAFGNNSNANNNRNILTGKEFEEACRKKHALHASSEKSNDIFNPISNAANISNVSVGNSLIYRVKNKYKPKLKEQLRVVGESSTPDANCSYSEQFEDTFDDAILNVARFLNEEKEKKKKKMIINQQKMNQISSSETNLKSTASAAAAVSSSSDDDDDEATKKVPLFTKNNGKSATTPKHVASAAGTPSNLDDAASATPVPQNLVTTSVSSSSKNNNETSTTTSNKKQEQEHQEQSPEWSPWHGCSSAGSSSAGGRSSSPFSPSSTYENSNNNENNNQLPPPNQTTATNSSFAACLSFLRRSPSSLPCKKRGTISVLSRVSQPISGISLSSSSSFSSNINDDNVMLAAGSRSGNFIVGHFSKQEFLRKIKNSNNNIENSRTRNNINFEIEDLCSVRNHRNHSSHMILDTAIHSQIPLAAAVGGAPEVVFHYTENNNNNNESNSNNNEPARSSFISRTTVTSNPLPRNEQTDTPAQSIVVDIAAADTFRSYIFGVDFFAGSRNSVVCGCSSGIATTVTIRPDGTFAVTPHNIHNDDINDVSRFGSSAESPLYLCGSDDRKVSLSDSRVAEGRVQYAVGHTNGVMGVCSRGDDYYFASTSKDQTVKVFDARNLRSPVSSLGMNRRNLMNDDGIDDNDNYNYGGSGDVTSSTEDDDLSYRLSAVRWNHYNSPETAPAPSCARKDNSVMTGANSHRFCYTLSRCKFSPMSTGGRFLLFGGIGAAQIFDLVTGVVVGTCRWDESSVDDPANMGDDMCRDVAWIDEKTILVSTQQECFVFHSN